MNSGCDSKSSSPTSDDTIRAVLTEHTAASKLPAAHDDKDIAQSEDNPDMELTATSTKLLKETPMPTVILNVPTWWVKFYDIAGIDELPKVLHYLCLAYADYLPEEKVTYQYSNSITISSTSFFTRYISQIQYRLEQAANDFLREGNIDKALALIEQNSNVINIETRGTDRLGRCIKGRTLLQIAGMGSDVNLREKKVEEKDHGAVELFAQAAKLTKDEVATQLFPVLFSNEAKNANEARQQRVLAVVKEFGESIIRRKTELPESWDTIEEFRAAQAKCQPEIDKLRNDLIRIVSNEVTTFGYIFDTHIYDAFCKWFTDNRKRFSGWSSVISDLIWVNGYGSLQYVASAADAHIHRQGIGTVVDFGVVPTRTFINSDGSTYFTSLSRLGLDFYLGYYTDSCRWYVLSPGPFLALENLCQAKTTALQNLCNGPRPAA